MAAAAIRREVCSLDEASVMVNASAWREVGRRLAAALRRSADEEGDWDKEAQHATPGDEAKPAIAVDPAAWREVGCRLAKALSLAVEVEEVAGDKEAEVQGVDSCGAFKRYASPAASTAVPTSSLTTSVEPSEDSMSGDEADEELEEDADVLQASAAFGCLLSLARAAAFEAVEEEE